VAGAIETDSASTCRDYEGAAWDQRVACVEVVPPVPVLILYATAMATVDGEVRFFRDIYGFDAKLERSLVLAEKRR
jgi:murein L,D-transpeptidase YcbB/YkuD